MLDNHLKLPVGEWPAKINDLSSRMLADSMPSYFKEAVAVPTEPQRKYYINIAMQVTAILLYFVLLVCVLYNTFRYVVLAKRYKVVTHSLFYTFVVLLAITRIYQHASSFNYLSNRKLSILNNLSDGYSVCIGIS